MKVSAGGPIPVPLASGPGSGWSGARDWKPGSGVPISVITKIRAVVLKGFCFYFLSPLLPFGSLFSN